MALVFGPAASVRAETDAVDVSDPDPSGAADTPDASDASEPAVDVADPTAPAASEGSDAAPSPRGPIPPGSNPRRICGPTSLL